MANYDAFAISNYSAGQGTVTAAESPSAANRALTDNGGNPNVLGDVPSDTFTIQGLSQTYTYVGVTTYTNASGATVAAFVAEVTSGSKAGTYFLFTPHVAGDKPGPSQTITVTADNTGVAATQWNLGTSAPGCLLGGTRIATPSGDVAVESLVAGDLVLTADGRAMPVRWLGRSVVSRVFADPVKMLPIRIKAGALGQGADARNLPARDLLVSAGHAILVDDVLVHAGALVNGSSIVREHAVPVVFTYYHVELDAHALLLAEGAPVESFLEGVDDMDFANWAERAPRGGEEMAYPRAKSPRQVPHAARARLAARAIELSGRVAEAA